MKHFVLLLSVCGDENPIIWQNLHIKKPQGSQTHIFTETTEDLPKVIHSFQSHLTDKLQWMQEWLAWLWEQFTVNIFKSDVILIHPRLQSESDIIPDIVTGIGNGLRMKSGQTSGESTPTKTTCSVFTAVSLTNDYICLYSCCCLSFILSWSFCGREPHPVWV